MFNGSFITVVCWSNRYDVILDCITHMGIHGRYRCEGMDNFTALNGCFPWERISKVELGIDAK